jgi:hypothetical protein
MDKRNNAALKKIRIKQTKEYTGFGSVMTKTLKNTIAVGKK